MEYYEFVEELEKSLLDQMKGETAFSIQAQTIQNNGEDQKEILIAGQERTGGFPCRQKKHMTISWKEYR